MHPQAIADFASALEYDDSLPLHLGVAADSRFSAGFAIHRNNVNSVRIDALKQTFPVLERLLGQEYFTALGTLFISQHPPRSAVLHEYGGELADFIKAFSKLAPMNYLADIARLEWARLCAFHAADERPIHFDASDIAALEQVLMQPLRWHPSATLLQSAHPLFSLWESQTLQADSPITEQWQSENVLVWRNGLALCTEPVDERSCQLLRSVEAGFFLADQLAEAADEQDTLMLCIARMLQWQVFCPVG